MNKDEFMRVVYTSFGISPETTFEEAGKQFKEMLHNVGQCLAEVERKAEVDYDTTIESIKAYLTARGLALPKDFKAFWDWYVIYYGDYLAEYELDIKQEQINEYSLKLTAKLDNRETPPHKAERITLKQIALIYAYEGKYITDQNSNEVAREYGYTSGHKLKQEYDYFRKPINRKGLPAIVTNKTIQNKINLLNSVLPYLTDNNKSKVNDEVKILEASLIA